MICSEKGSAPLRRKWAKFTTTVISPWTWTWISTAN